MLLATPVFIPKSFAIFLTDVSGFRDRYSNASIFLLPILSNCFLEIEAPSLSIDNNNYYHLQLNISQKTNCYYLKF